jgi:DNA-directed RNA polymerase subunit RPC12/RpoP
MSVMPETTLDSICINCGKIQAEESMDYSSVLRGWLCSDCSDNEDVPIRVSAEAHKWLMKNRGSGSVKKLIDKVIVKYQEAPSLW